MHFRFFKGPAATLLASLLASSNPIKSDQKAAVAVAATAAAAVAAAAALFPVSLL